MENNKVINLYEVLGVKRNATFKEIKIAYMIKVEAITNAFKSGSATNYTANDLILANKALETFSTSIGRYIHDCEIDGEEPDFGSNGEDYYAETFEGPEDFTKEEDKKMVEWLKDKIELYYRIFKQDTDIQTTIVITNEEFNQIIDGMVKNCSALQESLDRKITAKRQLCN